MVSFAMAAPSGSVQFIELTGGKLVTVTIQKIPCKTFSNVRLVHGKNRKLVVAELPERGLNNALSFVIMVGQGLWRLVDPDQSWKLSLRL